MGNETKANNLSKSLSSTILGANFDSPTQLAFYFQITMEDDKNSSENYFQEVSGIGLNLEHEPAQENENIFVHRLPNSPKHPRLVLKRGIINKDSLLAQWCVESVSLDLAKPVKTKSLNVHLKSHDGDTLCTWSFTDAYPFKLQGMSLNAKNEQMALELIEFSYNSCTENNLAFI